LPNTNEVKKKSVKIPLKIMKIRKPRKLPRIKKFVSNIHWASNSKVNVNKFEDEQNRNKMNKRSRKVDQFR